MLRVPEIEKAAGDQDNRQPDTAIKNRLLAMSRKVIYSVFDFDGELVLLQYCFACEMTCHENLWLDLTSKCYHVRQFNPPIRPVLRPVRIW